MTYYITLKVRADSKNKGIFVNEFDLLREHGFKLVKIIRNDAKIESGPDHQSEMDLNGVPYRHGTYGLIMMELEKNYIVLLDCTIEVWAKHESL